MRPSHDTRDKIIHLADELIRMKGYNAFSYKDIAEMLAVRNAAVHYYFQTKGELGVQVVDRELRLFQTHQQSWSVLRPNEQLKKLFDRFGEYNNERLMCLMGSLSTDFETLPAAVRSKVKELSNVILDWLTDILEEGRLQGLLNLEGSPYDRSLLIMSDLMSSLLLSKVLGTDAFIRISTQLLKDLT